MKIENIICDYCKKPVPKQIDEMPTWFGRYIADELIGVICIDCLPKNREKWREGGKP
jgi:hypothetical protein